MRVFGLWLSSAPCSTSSASAPRPASAAGLPLCCHPEGRKAPKATVSGTLANKKSGLRDLLFADLRKGGCCCLMVGLLLFEFAGCRTLYAVVRASRLPPGGAGKGCGFSVFGYLQRPARQRREMLGLFLQEAQTSLAQDAFTAIRAFASSSRAHQTRR